jgi:hypothetical protein
MILSSQLFVGMLFFYFGAFIVALPFLTLFVLIGRAIVVAPSSPMTALIGMVLRLPPRFYVTSLCAPVFLAAYTTFKINIPHVMDFYADPSIAAIDHWLHGTDPWRLARSLPPATSLVIDFLYSRVWFLISLVTIIHIAMTSPPAEFRRFVAAGLTVYIGLGVVLGTLFSSVGPIYYNRFYPNGPFGDLVTAIANDTYAVGQKQYIDYLYSAYMSKTLALGSGISAMPSIHVAMAVLVAWYATSKGRAWFIAGWAYALVILFSSIYTGWHYAIDGYFSALVTSVVWFAVSRFYGLSPTGSVSRVVTLSAHREASR